MSDTEIVIVMFGLLALAVGAIVTIMGIREWFANRKLKSKKDEGDES